MHWLLRQSQEPNAQVRALYERLQAGGSEILAKTDLRVSGRLRRPAVVGLFQPTILIPASFDAELGDLEQLRLSLLHEMAHVEQPRSLARGRRESRAIRPGFFFLTSGGFEIATANRPRVSGRPFAASRFG